MREASKFEHGVRAHFAPVLRHFSSSSQRHLQLLHERPQSFLALSGVGILGIMCPWATILGFGEYKTLSSLHERALQGSDRDVSFLSAVKNFKTLASRPGSSTQQGRTATAPEPEFSKDCTRASRKQAAMGSIFCTAAAAGHPEL